jgi:hypothetical protein
MAATLCAYCGNNSTMLPRYTAVLEQRKNGPSYSFVYRTAAACSHCSELMIASYESVKSGLASANSREVGDAIRDTYSVQWTPRTAGSFKYPFVPEHIARAAEEAHQDAQINNFMSAILMARTTVEATAKDKGITKGRLVEKIDELKEQGHIRKPIADAAHEIRHFGNDMAHGDITDLPDGQDVEDILALMDAVLRDVYETTAITASIINRRQG